MTFRYQWSPGGLPSPRVEQRIAVREKQRRLLPLCPDQPEWVLRQRALPPRRRRPRTR